MARLIAGNRVGLYYRSTAAITWNTIVGSPARFDSTIAPGSVVIPPQNVAAADGPPILFSLPSSRSRVFIRWDAMIEGGTTNAPSGGGTANLVAFFDVSGNPLLRLNNPLNQYFPVSIFHRNNLGNLVQLGATWPAYSPNALISFCAELQTGLDGYFRLWQGATMVLERTWTTTGSTNQIAFIGLYNPSNSWNMHCSQFIIDDLDNPLGVPVPTQVLTGTGFVNEGAGTPANTGDLNFNTSKTLTAAGQRFLGTKPAFTFPEGTVVDTVMMNILGRAAPGLPNARPLVRHGGNTGNGPTMSPALTPAFIPRHPIIALNPVTGLPWTNQNYIDAEFGLEALA